jgi:hypothetical protein
MRVSKLDLEYAADWLRAYEVGDDASDIERNEAQLRVAEWLEAEIHRREESAAIRDAAKQYRKTPAQIRAALNIVRRPPVLP